MTGSEFAPVSTGIDQVASTSMRAVLLRLIRMVPGVGSALLPVKVANVSPSFFAGFSSSCGFLSGVRTAWMKVTLRHGVNIQCSPARTAFSTSATGLWCAVA